MLFDYAVINGTQYHSIQNLPEMTASTVARKKVSTYSRLFSMVHFCTNLYWTFGVEIAVGQ
jgi:hypothetical protein